LGQKIQKIFVSENTFFQKNFLQKYFFHFFLLQNLVTFWEHKIQNNIFDQIPFFLKKYFLEKNKFEFFCVQNVTKFCIKKQFEKKHFFDKKNWKIFF
jgi:hypothetical protein